MRFVIPAALLVALWSVGPVAAKDVKYASYSDVQRAYAVQGEEITGLRTRLASLESAMETYDDCGQSCDDGCDSSCGDCCGSSCDSCCGRPSGIVAGAELAFLKPHAANGFYGFWDTDIAYGFETAPRVWLGYTDSSGLGFRVRWFGFDHAAFAPADDRYSESADIDLSVFDVEVTATSQLGCNWDATIAGGVRHVDFGNTLNLYDQDGVVQESISITSGNIGLVVGAEVRRHFYQSLSVFTIVRGSVVFGDEGIREYYAQGWDNFVILDTQKYIWETQLGVEWTRCLASGAQVFVRGAAEAQYWDAETINGGALSLGGFTVAAGIMR